MHPSLLFSFCCLVVTQVSAAVWSGAGNPDNIWDPANWHQGAAPTYEDPVWEISAGLTARVDTATAPAWIIKRGEGALVLGSSLPDTISLEVEQGTVSWTDPVALGHLRLSGGLLTAGQSLQVGLMEIAGATDLNLATLPNLSVGTLRVESTGTVTWSENVLASSLEIEAGLVDFTDTRVPASVAITLNGGEMIGGILESQVTATGGTLSSTILGNFYLRGGHITANGAQIYGQVLLEGGMLSGYLGTMGSIFTAWYGGQVHIAGTLYMESMGALGFPLEFAELTQPIVVTGEFSSSMTNVLDFGLIDWHDPYWDEIRQFTVIDVWEGGVVNATFAHDETIGDGQGLWSRADNTEGDLIMRWTPQDVAPVPEASTTGLLALAALALVSVRRKRHGRLQ